MFKQLFCKAYEQWLKAAVQPGSPLVVFMDWTLTSKCKYCMALRAMLFGAGVTLLLFGWWLTALVFLLIPVLLTLGERYWLCEPEA